MAILFRCPHLQFITHVRMCSGLEGSRFPVIQGSAVLLSSPRWLECPVPITLEPAESDSDAGDAGVSTLQPLHRSSDTSSIVQLALLRLQEPLHWVFTNRSFSLRNIRSCLVGGHFVFPHPLPRHETPAYPCP